MVDLPGGALTIGRRLLSCPCGAMMLRPTSPHSPHSPHRRLR